MAIYSLLYITSIAFLLNLPFGYLRGGARRFSLRWFLYIHLPIPFIVFLRLNAGFDYRIIPLVIFSAFLGQFLGGRSFKIAEKRRAIKDESYR